MDAIREYFNSAKPKKTILRGSLTEGLYLSKDSDINELNKKESHRRAVIPTGTDYVKQVQDRENELYVQNLQEVNLYDGSLAEGLESLERLTCGASTSNIPRLTEEAMTEVYSKYTFKRKENNNILPINNVRDKILAGLQGFSVIIIEGPTGCGKTTQVPQWILDDCYQKHLPCKIVVTQPRRIAAISIAKRVAQERGWDVGGLVGYQVGLDNKTSTDSRITYVTTGVLLQKLVNAKSLKEYTHIILDEVHERGQEMDFLLLVVKKLLFSGPRNVKVILMSATFNSNKFEQFFSIGNKGSLLLPESTCFKVPKNEMFPVSLYYIDQLHKLGLLVDKMAVSAEPGIHPELHSIVLTLINSFENIDEKEHEITDRSQADLPSVLVFLPGINEIEELFNCLNDLQLRQKLCGKKCANYNWWVLPLHSTITAEEQVRVFHRASPGTRKIILSTNIAESSITVPDVKYVIDYCLMKTLVADEQTHFTSLCLAWASKTNCEQRSGRAGRVREGRVYRLVTAKQYDTFEQEPEPEIVRCPLERLVLLAKMLDMGPPSDILALAMDPPDMSNIRRTLLVLKEIGGLKKTVDGMWSDEDGDITYLGRIMAKLPLDVKVSKMIMLGHIFGVLEQCIAMAAAMSVKNLFSSPFRERLNAYNSKLTWADGSTSDCIAMYHVYRVWCHLRQQNYFKHNNDHQWARKFFVQSRALREMDDLVRELKMRLSREGIEPTQATSPWSGQNETLAFKVVMAGAFYPQYFIQASTHEDRERDAVKMLGGLDPRDTVYLKNFPSNQPGELYAVAIKNAVRQIIQDEPTVTFDKNSQKVYLTFGDNDSVDNTGGRKGDPTIPGQVLLPVYKSIKARQLKMDIRIPLVPVDKARELAAALEVSKLEPSVLETMVPRLPDINDTHMEIKISQFITVSKFWVQNMSSMQDLEDIYQTLNSNPMITHTGSIRPGDMYAAPYSDGGWHRARIVKLLPRDMVQILYTDWGAMAAVNTSNLRIMPPGVCTATPPLAMRCRLSGVAPAPLLGDRANTWSNEARQRFDELCKNQRLMCKVYSVVQGVVAIELLARGGTVNVNQDLLRAGLAVSFDESYDSKMNHDLRISADELSNGQIRHFNKEQKECAYKQAREVAPPARTDCCQDVVLKGAYSPLESCLHPLMYGSLEKSVNIEWHSVNSVLLDTDPQQMHEKLVVAANVGQSEQSSSISVRHTTVMPNVPGLPAIMALLFCHTAEFRYDGERIRFVSALCGLGSDEAGTPYFPEHDLLVNIDADLDIDDVRMINHVRYLMDFTMFCAEGQDQPADDPAHKQRVPSIIKENLICLLQKRRKYREPQAVPNAWEWKSVPEEDCLELAEPDMAAQTVIYPLLTVCELNKRSMDQLADIKRENDNLKQLIGRTPISSLVLHTCKLCGTVPMPTHAMRIHLYSNTHLEKEEDLAAVNS